MTHADDHVIMRVWCMRLNEHMQMSAVGRAGVQRSMCCVLEVRKQRAACVVTLEGRPQQRREQGGWCRRTRASDEGGVRKFSMFADGSLDEASAVSSGRRPEAIADEFVE